MYNMRLRRGAPQDAFHSLLQTHHTIDVRVILMDLDHNEIPGGDLSPRLMDGQVTVDSYATITRSLDLDLLDPNHALHLDSNSPDAGALFADRMCQVVYGTVSPLGDVRYDTPVFTGPVTSLERDGAALKVECQGKEVFGLAQAWNTKSFKKGVRVTTAIRYILTQMMGETKLNIPNLKATLRRHTSVGGDRTPWAVAKALASAIGYQLFFDGAGVCQMRKKPFGSVFTFTQGPGGCVKTEPNVGFDISKIINAVSVWGKKPKKKKGKPAKKRPHARLVAQRSHPLSPWKLGRNGGPRFLPLVIEDDTIDTNAEAKARARKELAAGLLEAIDVSYDSLVIPHLEELDVVQLNTSKFGARHRMVKFGIPLTSEESMTVGYVRNVKPKVSAIRVKKSREH